MPVYTVDPVKFHAEGALLNWGVVARRLGIGLPQDLKPAVELRWMLAAGLGLPTEPFCVWARPHGSPVTARTLAISQMILLFAGGQMLVSWKEGRMSRVEADVVSAAGGTAFAFSGGPLAANTVSFAAVAAGSSTVRLNAKFIDCLSFTPGITISAVRGVAAGEYANAGDWTLVETVGLPVSRPQWSGVGGHGSPQGLAGALSDAPKAAINRLQRGAPPVGWSPNLAAGVPAPPWSAPDFNLLVKEVNSGLLDFLQDIARNSPPNQQAAQSVTVPLPPPANSLGGQVNKPGTTTKLVPLPMTYMSAMSDPFLNLVLGFGTAYPWSEAVQDFMITAHWENGLDGASAPLDYAAVVPSPGPPFPPSAPANLATDLLGILRPLDPDGPWRASIRTSWDRLPDSELFRAASFALASLSVSPAGPAVALLEKRYSGGYRPICVNNATSTDPEAWRMHALDRELEIPSNPGSRQMKYAAATQDLYGEWTPWSPIDLTITQPELEPVRISAAKLVPTIPAGGSSCPTSLEIDFAWDWRIRSPRQISFVGRLFVAAHHGDPPPSVVVPAGLDRSLAGAGTALIISFNGDTPSAPGADFTPLTESGEQKLAGFGAAQGATRRYRMTVTGLTLDFAATPFVGLALWAQGQERIAPQRLSPWQSAPSVISTGDPRPPVVPVFHVKLGSLPDAGGASHVRISWAAQQNAVGYFIYEATESALLDAWGLPEPHPSDTLDARLLVLRYNLNSNPVRKPFHRWNSRALTASSADIELPRGSRVIHLYVVLGISAGQVESEWPSGSAAADSFITVAAPHVTRPAPPMIEVQRLLQGGSYLAKLLVTTRPGPRPALVEIHRVRVDDAAREVDTMGPPIARLSTSTGPWIVNSSNDPDYGAYIVSVEGQDAPDGSWRRVWYRATAWTGEDPARGGLPGRSDPSNAAFLVLPPSSAPGISAISSGGGAGPADAILEWSCSSPVARTPLGPHLISVRAKVPQAAAPPLISLDAALDALESAPPASGSGVWKLSTSGGVTTYRAILRRAAAVDAVNFSVRITDPLGRSGSQNIALAGGPVDPAPDLENLKLKSLALPAPPHLQLSFSSSSPVKAPLSGPYLLKITGVPLFPVIFPPPLTLSIALGAVPTRLPIWPIPSTYLLRTGPGPLYDYTLVTTAKLKGFVVRITAPNGAFVEMKV